ncbi:ankyrin repeat protein, partial [Lepidopterella palustris CBS 459.81]
SALHIAANSGSIPLVQLLLDHGFDVEFESSSRRGVCHETPLGAAALNGQKDVVQCLLKRGADINRQVCHYQFTPIRNAARVGNTKAIKLLLDFGADPYAGPYSALHDAAFYGHYEAVKALVDSGIDVN